MFNEYTIEYAEDILMRDTELQSTRKIALMRYVPETKKILVIPENADNILVMDEDFKIVSRGKEFYSLSKLYLFLFIMNYHYLFYFYLLLNIFLFFCICIFLSLFDDTLLQCSSRDIKYSISIYYLL